AGERAVRGLPQGVPGRAPEGVQPRVAGRETEGKARREEWWGMRRSSGGTRRLHNRGRIVPALGLVWLAAACAGCSELAGGVEFAPAVPPTSQAPSPSAAVKPDVGPWFVDRAHDFGVDVITLCGSPDKPSLLHSLGSGVALFDFDGDG